ncbi:ketoacyl-ACP synthase III family protein [Streptacidiphilus jiangxiensis]|uniref:3-oxoacyl-[acyl-carrier-protein] synthase-3 n=1 Tax=Streptacidiphilus jiangxiensis TaxID=235985 RepID=A0A1H7I3U8_STRJI|nr:ketoacyl-ACP synthase III family protein [Streptacidiphilus jiangxiensis]SEK56120.1 3-oxoacyl-[acyl-carrier-protein] synthase-3 [Streptacidiphilus jiangxiensis]
MRVAKLYMAGIASYLPEPFPADRAVAMGLYDETEWKNSGWTGAAVAGAISAPEMAVGAARRALARSGHRADEVALLLHASAFDQGPDLWSPQHYVLRHALGTAVPAMEVRQGCNGALAGMELAHGYLSAGPDRVAALVTAADNFGTSRMDRWRYQSGVNTNRGSIFGDAGTAVVMSSREGFARVKAMNSTSLPEFEEMNRPAGPLFPPAVTLDGPIDLSGRLREFTRRFPDAAAAAKQALHNTRTELGLRTIAEAGLTPADIVRVTHVLSGGEEYIRSVLGPMGIDPGRGMLEFGRDVGHMSVNDHLAALTHLVETRQVAEGDHILMINNGVGVSVSAAVIEITCLPSWATGSPQPYEETK